MFWLDEWIDGKFLPKGTICFINVWGLHHDDAKFPNHEVFDPDHYKGRTLLAAEYANSADYENRDHYGYGMFHSTQVQSQPPYRYAGHSWSTV